MRTLLLTSIAIMIAANVLCQDLIIKHDGAEIEAKVLEITESTIRYKEFSFQDGPTRNIGLSEVFMVIYENGRRENFSEYREKNVTQKRSGINERGNYFAMAPGYGNSYGGFGLRLQYVTPGKVRVGIHAGAGYFPFHGDWILISGGVQIYFWQYMYTNLQFGSFGARYRHESWFDGYQYRYDTRRDLLYGPSLLLGYDWFLTDHFGLNFGSGISIDVGGHGGVFWGIDSGLVFRF